MPRKAKGPTAPAATTAQALGSLLKSARDIMRKDKGLNGDLDRLPLLTWIMFLKFLDDLEQQREQEAKLAGKKFRPAIEKPYRWRDWAAAGSVSGVASYGLGVSRTDLTSPSLAISSSVTWTGSPSNAGSANSRVADPV